MLCLLAGMLLRLLAGMLQGAAATVVATRAVGYTAADTRHGALLCLPLLLAKVWMLMAMKRPAQAVKAHVYRGIGLFWMKATRHAGSKQPLPEAPRHCVGGRDGGAALQVCAAQLAKPLLRSTHCCDMHS